LAVTLAVGLAAPAPGQQTAADTAHVILNTARRIEREGRAQVARELLRFLRLNYAGTPAAMSADSLLKALPRVAAFGTGRTGFVLFNTMYGAFLGVAIPAALNADGPEPYGAGLLIGAPLGFFASREFARPRFRTAGQAGIASFATVWGTWQGLALQQATNLGGEEICGDFGCYTSESDTAPWTAMVIGGAAGIATGWALAASKEIPAGTSTLVSHSAFWGTWFGLTLGVVADLEDKNLFASLMLGGNAGLLAAIPAAGKWRPSSSRVRLITAGGVAGALVGFGIDLLGDVSDEGTVLGIPAATSALGLIIGAVTTRNRADLDEAINDAMPSAALVEYRDRLRLNVPMPQPTAFRIVDQTGTVRRRPGVRITLFEGRL